MQFAIRDDDICFFTKPQDLIKNYGNIWDICPISLSIVPFHACTKTGSLPPKYWSGNDTFPIGENRELVGFLRDLLRKNKIGIILHGYNHKDNPDGYEFETGMDLYHKLKQGKAYLERLFETKITAFVPPHNTLSKAALKALSANELNIVNIPSFRFSKRPFCLKNLTNWAKIRVFRLMHRNHSYPFVLDFGDHKEIGYYPLTPQVDIETLKNHFTSCHKMGGAFVLATHYWEFVARQRYNQRIRMGDVFYEFWEYVIASDNVQFVSVNQIFGDKT